MKHLSAYINWLMLTQTHLGHADTGMSKTCSNRWHVHPVRLLPQQTLRWKPLPFLSLISFLAGDKEGSSALRAHLPRFFHLLEDFCWLFFFLYENACFHSVLYVGGSLRSATALNCIYCILPCYNWLYLAIPHLYNNNKPLKLKQFHFGKKNVISPWVNL